MRAGPAPTTQQALDLLLAAYATKDKVPAERSIGSKWYDSVLRFDIDTPRQAGPCLWGSVLILFQGAWVPVITRFFNERHWGNVQPQKTDQAALAEAQKSAKPDRPVRGRDGQAVTLTIQKYATPVATVDNDGTTIDGPLPGDGPARRWAIGRDW